MSQDIAENAPLVLRMPPPSNPEGPPTVPPLRGDGKGAYKVHIVGNSGAFAVTTIPVCRRLLLTVIVTARKWQGV